MAIKRVCDRCGAEINPCNSVTYAGIRRVKVNATRWWVWYDCDARCPWLAPSGCLADALELQPSAVYGTNCRRRQRRRRKDDDDAKEN